MSTLDERSEESAKAHMEAILTEINGGTKVTMSKDCEKFLLEYLTSFVEQITVDSMQYARTVEATSWKFGMLNFA